MTSLFRLLFATALLVLLAACREKDHGHAPAGGHVHTAPHGGMLLEVGEHAYNLELLHDPAAGKLTVWVVDGHAENFVRLKAPTISLIASVAAEKHPLTLQAIANPATGETLGDTSQFEVQADWLKTATGFDVLVPTLEIRGTTFDRITGRLTHPAH